jgi:hypothetical protein
MRIFPNPLIAALGLATFPSAAVAWVYWYCCAASEIARILFFVFLVLLIVSALIDVIRKSPPQQLFLR